MGRAITEAQRAWLVDELAVWREEGLIDEGHARALLSLYHTPEELGRARQSRALATLTTLGALLVGLGLLLLIGYNWEAMAPSAKVGVILISLVTIQSVGLHLRYVRQRPAAAEVAFFLGAIVYGASIWLIAQIFHLSAQDGSAFWWWAAGVLPFALACDGLALHALYAALLAAWVGVEIIGYADLGFWLFGRWPSLPNGVYGLLAMVLPGLAWAYRRRSPRALAIYVPVLAWWAFLQPFTWHSSDFPVYFAGALGALLLLMGELHGASSPMAMPYRFYGGAMIAGTLIPLSFYDFNNVANRWIGRGGGGGDLVSLLAEVTLVLIVAVGLIGLAAWREGRAKGSSEPVADRMLAQARQLWLPLVLVVLMVVLSAWRTLVAEPLLPTIAANLAMLALAYWLLLHGLRDDRGVPFAAGTAYFLLWTVMRYIDLFGDFGGMLGGALMFFLCGAALFGVTYYWRQRTQDRLAAAKSSISPSLTFDSLHEPEVDHAAL